MKETTTVEVSREAHEAAMTAIESQPRHKREPLKSFASRALIEKAGRLCRTQRDSRPKSTPSKP
jgi:hypothetical protein